MTDQRNELVVVTGAASGIGQATAQRLAADGYHVLAGVRSEEDAGRIAGPHIEGVLVDITDAAAVEALAERVAGDPARRPLRAVVNNAGMAVNGAVEAVPLEAWRRQLEVGVIGQVAVTQALTPALLKSRGRIVNIGSLGGRVAMPGFGPYSAAKFAMEAVNDTLRREMEPLGLKVIVITPGAVSTGMTRQGLATIDQLARLMTPAQHTRHDRLVEAVRTQARAFARDGVRPEVAAAVVARAVSDPRPRTRYTVGTDAAVLTRLVRIIPDRLLDTMLRRQMHL